MKTSPAYPIRLSVPQLRPHYVLTLLLAVIISGDARATPPPPAQSAPDSGAGYVFTPDAAAAVAQQAYIKASNTEAEDAFGRSIALSGDTLAVGANHEDSAATGIDGDQGDNSAAESGAAYVLSIASNPDADADFGVISVILKLILDDDSEQASENAN